MKENPPRVEDGAIRFKQAGPEAALVGIAAFALRFADTWPVTDRGGEDDADRDAGDEEPGGGDGMFPTTPIKGAELLQAESGRVYNATMAMLLSEELGAEIPKRDRRLAGAGFRHVADVVCSAFPEVGIRGYARPKGSAWAFMRVSAPCAIDVEIVTTFEGGGSLVTTTAAHEHDDAASKLFRQGFGGVEHIDLRDLAARHDERVTELAATLGAPQPVVTTSYGLAEAVERQLREQ